MLVVIIIFLLATVVREQQRVEASDRSRDVALSNLKLTQDSIIAKLEQVFETSLRAEQQAAENNTPRPTESTEKIIQELQGVDPALVEQALTEAEKAIAGESTTTTTTSARAATTSTSRATTTTRSATTTTTAATPTSSSTTTTTTRCLLNLLGIKLGC